MKKKIAIGIFAGAILLGGGETLAFATSNENTVSIYPFERMMPTMKEVHPELSDQEIEQMHNTCHTEMMVNNQ